MKLFKLFLITLLSMVAGGMQSVYAQTAVTVGTQVTSEGDIVSGKAYVLRWDGLTGTPYALDTGGSYYGMANNNAVSQAAVYYLISDGNGYKIESAYTGKYWPTPSSNGQTIAPTTAANAGSWTIAASATANRFTFTCTVNATAYHTNRSSNKLVANTSDSPVSIYEVGLTLTSPVNIRSGWYMIKWQDISSDGLTDYADADVAGKYVRNYASEVTVDDNQYPLYLADAPTSKDENAYSLVYFDYQGYDQGRGVDGYLRSTNGHYVSATGAASISASSKNYIIYRSSSTPNYSTITSAYTGTRNSLIPRGKDAAPYIGQSEQNKFPVAMFYKVDLASLGLQEWSLVIEGGGSDIQVTYTGENGYGLKSVYNGGTFFLDANATPVATEFTAPAYLGFHGDIAVDTENHTVTVSYISINKVYTINNTNSGRGALIYNPDVSTKYVWSSGKSGTFDATQANSQWVIIPSGTDGQFYLYNVGAGKFAIPTSIAQGPANAWVFSDNAVAVVFETQGDGTKKIKMGTDPVNGTNAAYMAVSNNYTGPIINYNDVGGNFTITKVDDADASTAANAAIAKLINSQTALTSYPQATGWYAIQVKSKTGSASYAGRYLQTAASLYNDLYPLTFTGAVDVQPAITDPTFFTYINHTSWDVNTWQLPDGRFLVDNGSNKFPTPSTTAGNVICGYSNGNYFKTTNNYYADPYNNNASYFIGETTDMRTAYTVYPIDLAAAGLEAWKVICDNAPETAHITCTRSDVSGLTSVYKNGYFFLPTGVTPESTDFALNGSTSITVDATAHTITLAYDPKLAIVADDVSVYQGYGTTGLGNEKSVLLRIIATPFKDMATATLTATLTGADNISAVTLYETDNTVEWNAVSSYINTFYGTISGSTVTFDLGASVTAGKHYYWLCATVKSNAEVGSVIDAELNNISYNVSEQESTVCDLSDIGNPSTGMKVFDVQKTIFVPTTYISKHYRIPAVITANDGSIIAAADKRYDSSSDLGSHKIDVVVRRSPDGGKSWSEPVTIAEGDGSSQTAYGYGDPALVKTNSGKIICLMAAGKTRFQDKALKNIAMVTSSDNGMTWTSPLDITTNTGHFTDNASLPTSFFVTSGKGLCTADGVVMFLLDAYNSSNNETNYVLYSVDEGENWIIDATVVCNGANEAKLQQLKDGSLIASIRTNGKRAFNRGTYTKNNDGTVTFSWGAANDDITYSSTLNTRAGNNQDILYYSTETVPDVIFHTMTTGSHANLNLYMSIDQAKTWSLVQTIQPGGSRYAVMNKLTNGDLGILFEDYSLETGKEYPITYLTITAEQIQSWYEELAELDVTFHIYDGEGSTLLITSSPLTMHSIDSELPSSLKRAFCTYTMYSDAAMTHQISKIGSNTDVYVKCEYSGPVEFSTVENPKWYFLYSHKQNDTKDYVAYTENNEFKMAAASFFDFYSNKAYQWAFIGNPYDVRVLNRGNNGYLASSAMKAASNDQSLKAYVTTDVSAYPYYSFSLYGFSNSVVEVDNPFSLFLDPVQGTFLNGSNGNLYYHTSVVPTSELKLTNWKDANLMVLEVPATYPVTLNTVGSASYATLYLPFDVTTDANTKAYVIKKVGDGSAKMTELTGGEIAARTAVVLVNETSNSATFNVASGLSPQVTESTNLLKGTLVSLELDLAEGNGNYSLGRLDGQIGFIKYKNGENTTITLGANKAYLEVPASSGNVKGFTLGFGGEDRIGQVVSDESVNGTWYDLNGRRLSGAPAAKGVYIVGGKKVVVK